MRYIPPTNNRGDTQRLNRDAVNALINEVKALKATTQTFEQVIFTPIAEPASPVEGQTYMDSTTHILRTYNGTVWKDHYA